MLRFLLTFLLAWAGWILLTFSLSRNELLAGFFISILVAAAARKFLFSSSGLWLLNPVRWLKLLLYVIIFISAEIRAHLDVGYRVITGRVSPAIVKVKPLNRTEPGKTLLGNSITLTPGTLTVDVGDELYVHCISFKGEQPGKLFKRFGRGVV